MIIAASDVPEREVQHLVGREAERDESEPEHGHDHRAAADAEQPEKKPTKTPSAA
jgi:hypothetical protein